MNINCIVDIASREVSFQENYKIAAYDHNVDVIRFSIEPIEDFDLDLSSIKIAAQGPNKARHDYAVDPSTVQIEEETGYITFDWPIPAGVTEMPIGTFKYGDKGNLIFAVCAEIISGDTVSKAWHSDDGIITVVAHLEPEAGGGEDPEEEATNAQKIGQLPDRNSNPPEEISGIASGTPPTADSTDDMDHEVSTVYINTTDGKWYYWDGTAWTSGGVYGGAVTDTTLSVSGAPADAKAVGDVIKELQDGGYVADQQKISEKINDWLDEHPEATTTVQDGSLTDVKFSNALKLATIKDYVTPEMYGAVADDSTDCASAFESALNSGNPVFVPPGTYYISRPLQNPTKFVLIGSGKYVSNIRVGDSIFANAMTNSIVTDIYFYCDQTNDITAFPANCYKQYYQQMLVSVF